MSEIHYQRLAWDSARIIVAAIEADMWPWLAYQMGERIGPEYRDHLVNSFTRMSGHPDRNTTEAGLWRATLTDLLTHRPAVGTALTELMSEARAQLVPAAA